MERNKQRSTNVLILDSGGRGDALAYKIRQSEEVGTIYIGPGNGGTDRLPDVYRLPINITNPDHIIEACQDLTLDFVLVGPEEPLVKGLADKLREKEIIVYGHSEKASQLEGSKSFALDFMKKYGIPHPQYAVFEEFKEARSFLENPQWNSPGFVIKADGLAAGKGVYVVDRKDEAEEALKRLLIDGQFGQAGKTVVIQEKLKGFEVSAMAIVSGESYALLPFSEDHKPVYDFDEGPNTGGMGVIAPHPLVTPELARTIEETIIVPTIRGMHSEGMFLTGTIYPGIMVTLDGPKVLEYNVRFGDPETQALMQLIEGDIFPLLKKAATGNKIGKIDVPPNKSTVVVNLVSGGYPGSFTKGYEIFGLVEASGVIIFHAGTDKIANGRIVTAGGRVLSITGVASERSVARDAAYAVVGENGIHFEKMHYRKDIGERRKKSINYG